MSSTFDYSDIGETCTPKQYVSQFQTAVPRIGGEYVANKGCWMATIIKIVFATDDGRYLVGQEQGIKHGREVHGLWIFYASGTWAGWRVNDTARPSFRLQEIDG